MSAETCGNCGLDNIEHGIEVCLHRLNATVQHQLLRIAELEAALGRAEAEAIGLREVAKVAEELLRLEDDQRSWSDGTWEEKREELEMRLGLIAGGETNGCD